MTLGKTGRKWTGRRYTYIVAVRNLSPNYVATSTAWLEEIVEELWTRSVALLPTLVLRSRFYGT